MKIAANTLFLATLIVVALISAANGFAFASTRGPLLSRPLSRTPFSTSTIRPSIYESATTTSLSSSIFLADMIGDLNDSLASFGAIVIVLFFGFVTKRLNEQAGEGKGGESSGGSASSESFYFAKTSSDKKASAKTSSTKATKSDVSIPYDAAAKLAYDVSKKRMGFDEYNKLFKERAVTEVKIKAIQSEIDSMITNVDGIKRAQNEGESSGASASSEKTASVGTNDAKEGEGGESSGASASSEEKASVSANNAGKLDVSIPYDAAALLSYDGSNKAMGFDKYHKLYNERAVTEVKIKRLQAKIEATIKEVGEGVGTEVEIEALETTIEAMISSVDALLTKRDAIGKEIGNK